MLDENTVPNDNVGVLEYLIGQLYSYLQINKVGELVFFH